MRNTTIGSDPLDAPDDRTSELDFAAMARAVWARRLRILVPVVLVLIASAVVVQLIAPEYKSTASILLQSQETAFTRPLAEQRPADQQTIDDQAVGSQVQLIRSRDVARQAIKQLSLVGNPEFDPLASGIGPIKQLLMNFGLVRDPYAESPDDRVLDGYFSALSVYPMDKSRVLTIEFASRDPDLSARAANTIADIYLEMQQATKRGESLGASEALSPQIEELRRKVATAEAAVEAYRSRNGLFIAQNNATLSTQQLADITAQLSAAKAQQTEAQSKAKLIRDMIRAGRPVDVSDITNNETVRRLVEQRAGLLAQLALEQQTLLPGHPRIKELKAQLAALEGQIRIQAEKTVSALENDATLAKARVEALSIQLDGQKAASGNANESEVELRALEREAKAQRDLLESYLSRFREASARATFQDLPADARIISRAVPASEPYFPKKLPIIIISTLAALVLALALVVTGELLSGRALVPVVVPPRRAVAEPPAAGPVIVAAEPAIVVAEPAGIVRKPEATRESTSSTARVEAIIRASRGTRPEGRAPVQILPIAVPVAVAKEVAPSPLPPKDEVSGAKPMALPEAAADLLRRAPLVTVPALETVLADLAGRCRRPIGRAHSLVFTGLADRAAISRAACDFGRGLSADPLRVVLVDLGRHTAERPGEPGLGDLIDGAASFADVIERDEFSRLHIISAGRADALRDGKARARLEIVAHALSLTYDVVLFDAGALRPESRAPLEAVLNASEAVILVVGAGLEADLPEAAKALADLGATEIISAAEPAQDRAAA